MQMLKRKSGITLVALIITIIILLILAGVSLSFVFNGGILDKAQLAVNEYENASQKEQNLLDQIDKYIENELGDVANDEPVVPSVDENGLATENTTIVAKDDPSIQIVIPKGFAPAILQTGTTQSLPGENGAVKNIMPANEWNNITKEDINRGIVVVDNTVTYDNGQETGTVSDFNEYVWIPMPDSSKFARVLWSVEGMNETLSEMMEKDKFWEDKDINYTNMVSSVNTNKGFYVGRYEASQMNDQTAQSKRNQSVWVNVSQTTAITVSSNIKPSVNAHLIYAIEWDSVLNWLNGNAIIAAQTNNKTKIMELADIQTDCRSWGNYNNSLGDAAADSSQLQSTGTSEYWKANNIYDLAGNAWEWTQEIFSTDVMRGLRAGSCNYTGNGAVVAIRNYQGEGYKNVDVRISHMFIFVVEFYK